MNVLVFQGAIISGIGRYSDLMIPGRDELPQAPGDWPKTLYRGSLNIKIDPEGYPREFEAFCGPRKVPFLDTGFFPPEFTIHRDQIVNNKLEPRPNCERRGHAQVWRAHVKVVDTSTTFDCWVLRRFGSGLCDQLECVSEDHLRSRHNLQDDLPVRVTLCRKTNSKGTS